MATSSEVLLTFLNGFVGEFLIMVGMFKSSILNVTDTTNWNYVAAMAAGIGVILAAVYLLWLVQRVFFGKVTHAENKKLTDLNAREIGIMIPLLIAMVVMGVYPRPFLERTDRAIKTIEARVMKSAGGAVEKTELDTKALENR